MAVIETVSIEDVYPLQDEYGNDLATRDYEAKANKAYVKELAESMRAKGVPDEMPVLVRDGGIYRIKSGNSRVMAMRLLGTKRFPAVVEDESTEQAVLETVIRTNTKKKYEDVEESRFVRQLALFGTDEYVAEVTGMAVEKAAKVRKGAELADDAAEDMSLLRLMAIADFEGDPMAVELLKNCSEKEFPGIEKELRQKAEREAKAAAIKEAIEGAGIEVADSAPKGWVYAGHVGSPEHDLSDGEGCIAKPCTWGVGYELYRAPGAAPADPEEEERKRRKAELDALYEAAEGAREEWLAASVLDPAKTAALMELPGLSDTPYDYRVANLMQQLRDEWPAVPACAVSSYLAHRGNICDWRGDLEKGRCEDFAALTDAMVAGGYEPPEEETALYRMAVERIGGEDE